VKRFRRFIKIVKSRFSNSSIATWFTAIVLAGWLLVGSGIEMPCCSLEPASSESARPAAPEMKRGLQIDVRIFSLRFHVRLASLDHETV
jgi:hypothetical protein